MGVELTANRLAVYIPPGYVPPGFAHGFQTLEPDACCQMTDFYQPGLTGGLRWDGPAFGIEWPLERTVNERDATYPDLDLAELECFRGFE